MDSNSKSNLENPREVGCDMNVVIVNAEISEADYYNIDDIQDIDVLLFTKQTVKQIMLYEKTVEMIGIVGQTEIRSNIMKFTLHNKNDDIIQILVWSLDIIEKIKPMIMPGNILHIDGAFSKHRCESLSAGNIEYDLNVMSNTKINMLRESITYSPIVSNSPVVEVSIENCCKFSNTIQIVGYIKNVISETSMPNSKINQGCLSDCQRYKLEVRMPVLCDMSEFSIGSHVNVRGTIKYAQHPYIWILKKSDIAFQSDEKNTIKDLLKGTHVLNKRPLQDSSNLSLDKKMLKTE